MSSTDKGCRSSDFIEDMASVLKQTELDSGRPQKPGVEKMPAIICDFDDTTAVENVAQLLLEHFSEDSSWQQLRQQAREKTITLKEYQERAFRRTTASREEMKALVKARATLRPYFKQLWQYCQANSVPLAIVTVGLDFYVEALLEREGLEDVPRYAVKTRFTTGGITYEYPYGWDGSGASPAEVCRQWGTCKCSVLAKYRRMGHNIFYVGDGRSDSCPASIADRVFAREELARYCRENQVPYTEFHDFQDVIQVLTSPGATAVDSQEGVDVPSPRDRIPTGEHRASPE